MDIISLGHSSFKLKGKQATVVMDPYDNKSQLLCTFPKHIEADIVTVSHDHGDHNAVHSVEGAPYVIHGPGEYEIKGVSIIGLPAYHDEKNGTEYGKNTLYRIEIDGVKIAHLGDLGHVLTSAQVDALDGIDVLCIPVGGIHTIDAAKAAMVVTDIEPHIVIPMHDSRSRSTLGSIDAFFKALNKSEQISTPVSKVTVHKDKLPAEMQILVLE